MRIGWNKCFTYFESLNKVAQNLCSLTLSSDVSVFKVGHQRRKCTKSKSLLHMIQYMEWNRLPGKFNKNELGNLQQGCWLECTHIYDEKDGNFKCKTLSFFFFKEQYCSILPIKFICLYEGDLAKQNQHNLLTTSNIRQSFLHYLVIYLWCMLYIYQSAPNCLVFSLAGS